VFLFGFDGLRSLLSFPISFFPGQTAFCKRLFPFPPAPRRKSWLGRESFSLSVNSSLWFCPRHSPPPLHVLAQPVRSFYLEQACVDFLKVSSDLFLICWPPGIFVSFLPVLFFKRSFCRCRRRPLVFHQQGVICVFPTTPSVTVLFLKRPSLEVPTFGTAPPPRSGVVLPLVASLDPWS